MKLLPTRSPHRACVTTLLVVLCAATVARAEAVLYYDFQTEADNFENFPQIIVNGLAIGSGPGWDPTGTGPDYGPGSNGGLGLYTHGFNHTAESMTLQQFVVQPEASLTLTDYSFELIADEYPGASFGFFIVPLTAGGASVNFGNAIPLTRDGVYHTYTSAAGTPSALPVTLGPGTYNIALTFGTGSGTGYVGLDNFTLFGTVTAPPDDPNDPNDPNEPNDPIDPNNPNEPNEPIDPNEPEYPDDPNLPLDVARLGAGSFATYLPTGCRPPSNSAGAPIAPKRTARVTGPMPTGDWWSSLGFPYFQGDPQSPFSSILQADPLGLRAAADGLELSYTTTATLDAEYHFRFARDLTVGVAGLAATSTLVDGYTDWTVTGYWQSGTNTLRATFGRGLPFVYCTKAGGNAQVAFAAAPTVWYNQNGTLGITVRGHHYGIFAPTGAAWTTGTTIQSSLAGENYFSVAVLPDNTVATLAYFRQFAFAFVTNTRVDWSYDEATAQLTSTYSVATTPREGTQTATLLALYRHQWLDVQESLTGYTYITARGQMKVRASNSFSTTATFNGVLPSLPDMGTYNRTTLFNYIDEVHAAGNAIPDDSDTYWTGKLLNRAALLVHIADQVGHTGARDHFLRNIKDTLQNWLTFSTTKTRDFFCYDRTWGTLIGYPAGYGSDTEINDHHFHYGYFLNAAATVARYDPAFVQDQNWGAMLKLLARDAAAGRGDPLFPLLRNYDIYAGHAWAAGHGAFASGNNQESVSESLNFATGLILLGAAMGDTELRDRGIFMYVNEVRAVEQYWFDVDQQVFPTTWPHANIGILWGEGGTYSTWFDGAPEAIHGIIFLPITGGSLYLGRDPAYVLRNYNYMVARLGRPEQKWRDIIWSFLALADPTTAVAKFNANPTYTPEEGETRAHTYHWIHNLNAMGQLDTAVTADTPTSAVFNQAGQRSYVAYNAGGDERTVRYSDGMVLGTGARQLVATAAPPCAGTFDLSGFAAFATCTQGPDQPTDETCDACARVDADGDVDLADFSALQVWYNAAP